MRDFAIISDTSCGLEKKFRDQYGIEYVCMRYNYGEKEVLGSLDWEEISAEAFYKMMREGTRFCTSQVPVKDYEETFEKAIKDGKDILSISCTSAISGSVNASLIAKDTLLKKYPDAKIICIDSENCCYGLGILCLKASELRADGKTIEETAEWVNENRKYIHQEGTVDSLVYLKQAGRVSGASAFFGGLLNIKPMIISDKKGYNVAVEKVKGRANSLKRILERFKERYVPGGYDKIFISHADCISDAEYLKTELQKIVAPNVEIHIGYVVSPIGATVGPGMIGLYFYGVEETYDSTAEK